MKWAKKISDDLLRLKKDSKSISKESGLHQSTARQIVKENSSPLLPSFGVVDKNDSEDKAFSSLQSHKGTQGNGWSLYNTGWC